MTTRPATDPEKLRQVADWLDLTDEIVASVMRQWGEKHDAERLPDALACLEGKEMQADLRRIAAHQEQLLEIVSQLAVCDPRPTTDDEWCMFCGRSLPPLTVESLETGHDPENCLWVAARRARRGREVAQDD